MANYLNFSPAASAESGIITQLRGELSDARKQLQQMRTQLLAAEEDAQLHAQDVSYSVYSSNDKLFCSVLSNMYVFAMLKLKIQMKFIEMLLT